MCSVHDELVTLLVCSVHDELVTLSVCSVHDETVSRCQCVLSMIRCLCDVWMMR